MNGIKIILSCLLLLTCCFQPVIQGIPVTINEGLATLNRCLYASHPVEDTCPPGCFPRNSKCYSCPLQSFKKLNSSEGCIKCGKNSISDVNQTMCICKDKHYRKFEEQFDYSAPCIDTLPRYIYYKVVDEHFFKVQWNGITDRLDEGEMVYTFECTSCTDADTFRAETKKAAELKLKRPRISKFYSVTLTVSIIHSDKKVREVLHVVHEQLFIGKDSDSKADNVFIVIVSIAVPVVLTFAISVMLLYTSQRRRRMYFERKLVSLKRKQRPPLPPRQSTEDITDKLILSSCNQDNKNDEYNPYTIKPYAILNFKSGIPQRSYLRQDEMFDEANRALLSKYEEDKALPGYVSMNANQGNNEKMQDARRRPQCPPNDYIIRENVSNQPVYRPRPMSWYLHNAGLQHQLDEMARHEQFGMESRAQSGYLIPQVNQDVYHFPNHTRWSRPNSSHIPHHQWGIPPDGSATPLGKRRDDGMFHDYRNRIDYNDLNHNAWPMGIHGRVRTQSFLNRNQADLQPSRYLRSDMPQKHFVPFPPTLFDEKDVFEERLLMREHRTPRCGQRTRSRTIMCPEEHTNNFQPRGRSRTVMDNNHEDQFEQSVCTPNEKEGDKLLSVLDQVKLLNKYKRAESKEKLCAADYVKLRRAHSADDVNIVHGMEQTTVV